MALWPYFRPYAWFLFFPAVYLASWLGSLQHGLFATFFSTVLVYGFFVPPEGLFVMKPEHHFVGGVFLFIGILTSVVTDRMKKALQRHDQEQAFLAEAGSTLATSLELPETLSKVAELAVARLADVCIVETMDERGRLRRLKVVARDPSRNAACSSLMRIPVDRSRDHLAYTALTTRKPFLLRRASPKQIAAYAQSTEHAAALRAMNIQSMLAVPLLAHDKAVGAIVLISSSRRRLYGKADARLAEELAGRAALAIDNARLYGAAQRAIRARNELLGVVAHDLRNPLAAILMRASSLRRRGSESWRDPERAAMAIERAAHRMNRLIEDLLDVARLESGRLPIAPSRVTIVDMISEAVEACRSAATAAGLEISFDEPPRDLPDLWADRHRLLQVFENLLGNAIKFTQAGGQIRVGVTAHHGQAVFFVADTGSGIAAEDVPHVFDRFWQADRDERRLGAGLGLAIAKGIVDAHGGSIWVESARGLGSTFYFTIPFGAPASPWLPESAPQH
jgi:signal transduction histidine kinase